MVEFLVDYGKWYIFLVDFFWLKDTHNFVVDNLVKFLVDFLLKSSILFYGRVFGRLFELVHFLVV